MLFAGFGFLMTFLKNYGYSAISFTVMVTVIITEFGILCFGFSRVEDGDYTIRLTMIEWVKLSMCPPDFHFKSAWGRSVCCHSSCQLRSPHRQDQPSPAPHPRPHWDRALCCKLSCWLFYVWSGGCRYGLKWFNFLINSTTVKVVRSLCTRLGHISGWRSPWWWAGRIIARLATRRMTPPRQATSSPC